MKWLLMCLMCSVVLLFVVGGCNEEQKSPQPSQRALLEQRFQEAYPNDWKTKLLEYDWNRIKSERNRI